MCHATVIQLLWFPFHLHCIMFICRSQALGILECQSSGCIAWRCFCSACDLRSAQTIRILALAACSFKFHLVQAASTAFYAIRQAQATVATWAGASSSRGWMHQIILFKNVTSISGWIHTKQCQIFVTLQYKSSDMMQVLPGFWARRGR